MPTRRNWLGRTASLTADEVWRNTYRQPVESPPPSPASTLPYEPVSDELLAQACRVYCDSRITLLKTAPASESVDAEYLRIKKRLDTLNSSFWTDFGISWGELPTVQGAFTGRWSVDYETVIQVPRRVRVYFDGVRDMIYEGRRS